MLIFIAYINPRKRHQNSLRRNVGIVCYYYELVTSFSLSSPVQSHPLSFCLHFILRDSMVLFQASSGKNCEYRAVSIGNRTTYCSFSKCYLHEKNSKDSHDRYRQSPNQLSKELLLNPVISKLGKQVVLLLINSFSSSVNAGITQCERNVHFLDVWVETRKVYSKRHCQLVIHNEQTQSCCYQFYTDETAILLGRRTSAPKLNLNMKPLKINVSYISIKRLFHHICKNFEKS